MEGGGLRSGIKCRIPEARQSFVCSPLITRAKWGGGVAMAWWQSACLACTEPWVQSPVPSSKKRKRMCSCSRAIVEACPFPTALLWHTCLLWCSVCSRPGPRSHDHCTSVVSLNTGQRGRWALLFFVTVVLVILGSLHFHIHFRSSCQFLQRKLRFSLDIDWSCAESVARFRKNCPLTGVDSCWINVPSPPVYPGLFYCSSLVVFSVWVLYMLTFYFISYFWFWL